MLHIFKVYYPYLSDAEWNDVAFVGELPQQWRVFPNVDRAEYFFYSHLNGTGARARVGEIFWPPCRLALSSGVLVAETELTQANPAIYSAQ